MAQSDPTNPPARGGKGRHRPTTEPHGPVTMMTTKPKRTWKKCSTCGGTRKLAEVAGCWFYEPCITCLDKEAREREEREREEQRAQAVEAARARAEVLNSKKGQVAIRIPPKYHGAEAGDFGQHEEKVRRVCDSLVPMALFFGERGTGKTRAAYAACRAWYRTGRMFLFRHVPMMVETMRLNAGSDPGKVRAELDKLIGFRGLLVLDDIGAEKPSEYSTQQLSIVLDDREKWEKATLVTTELKPSQLASSLCDRIASRLSGGLVLKFTGKDRRLAR